MPALRSLLAVLLCASFAAADELRTLDNKTYTGTMVSVSEKEVSIKTAEGVIKVPLENVIALDLKAVKGLPPDAKYTDIKLIDDTVLHCKDYTLKGKDVEMTLLNDQKLKVPLAYVVYILKEAHDPKLRTSWDKLLLDKIKKDRVIVYKGGSFNTLEGTLGDPDETGERIQFRPAGASESVMVKLPNIQGLIFYRIETPTTAPVCMVYDTAGNMLAATKVSLDGTKISIETTIKGAVIVWEKEHIARFDYNMGKLGFLSDMIPTKVIEKSAVGLIVTHRKDANFDGEPILLDRVYAKGLSLHAHTELEFDLKGKYKKFTAVVGVDTRVGAESQAKLTIEVDGRIVFSKIITAKTVVPIDLDITKATTMRIIVASGNVLDLHDHLTIANPKVSQ